ncbi:hypothetical protein EDB81DRAFT_418568 [Dactylonectria macrodidyma]|uniref:HAUS augmin-like complex subunit 1 n=1 Tax=Dactylonectria macrodidyma TaxID=307937 RepID=A0A9P9FCB2_9HYPO|nr:hypothetical protein EDB81DRAFT_418568 [Dactylonectria macrodidyma]
MAHRRHHHHLSEDSAIFSPSVARIAASNARDWSYIDTWLASKLHPHPVPAFERNADTLKALLALASLNDATDEERQLLAKSEAAALKELSLEQSTSQFTSRRPLRRGLLDAVRHNLPAEGHTALDAMASMALQLSVAFPEPEDLGRRMVGLQASIQETEQMKSRVDILHRYIEEETSKIQTLLRLVQGDEYKPPAHLAKQNLDLQRKIKAMSAKLPELQDRVAALSASTESSHPTTADIAHDEQEYLAILAEKRDLDLQMATFHGLPSNPDMARSELEALRGQLRTYTSQRDAVFEGLVERESPVKRRR